jgi:phosphoserine phosphatase
MPTDRTNVFIDSILRQEPQLAVFDCDGTLWSGDGGESFFAWEQAEGLVPEEIMRSMRARYADYKAGNVAEEIMCGEMVTMHKGMIDAEVQRAATRFFDLTFVDNIFSEMKELVRRLQAQGCDVWAVSSTNEWVIRAGMRHFAIARDHILAAAVAIDNRRVTDQLVRVPSGGGKPKAIREVVKRDPDVAFGNSRWDLDMLAIARRPIAVNPNADLEETARQRGWNIYFPDGTQP